MTEITQADQDAAARLNGYDRWEIWLIVPQHDKEWMQLCSADFARHREQAAAEERAKIVAWLREQQVSIEKLRDAMNRFTAGWRFEDEQASVLEQSARAIEAREHETFTHPDNV